MGAVFHLIFGGDARRLALFLLAGWIGFAVGHFIGVVFEINLLNIGMLRIVTASIGAVATLITVQVLTAGQSRRRRLR